MSYWSLIWAIGFALYAAWIAALLIARLLTSSENTGIGFHVVALFAVSTLAAFAFMRAFPRRFSVDALMFGRIALLGSLALMLLVAGFDTEGYSRGDRGALLIIGGGLALATGVLVYVAIRGGGGDGDGDGGGD
jgi:hypothetical protein